MSDEQKPATEAGEAVGEDEVENEPEGPTSLTMPLPVAHRRHRIIQRYPYGEVTLREFDSIECDGAGVIEGFNKGITSLLTVDHIVTKLKLPLVGDIVSKNFQSYARVANGYPAHGCRIYGNRRVVVFQSEYEFKSPELQNCLVQAIFDFGRRHRSSMIISVDGTPDDPTSSRKKEISVQLKDAPAGGSGGAGGGGGGGQGGMREGIGLPPGADGGPPTKKQLLEQIEERETKIWFVTNELEIGEKLAAMGHAPVKAMAVTGISGGILAEAPFVDVPVCALFGNLEPLVKTRTAVGLVKCIDSVLGDRVEIDTSDLEETNRTIEAKIRELIDTVKTPIAAKSPQPWSGMYM